MTKTNTGRNGTNQPNGAENNKANEKSKTNAQPVPEAQKKNRG